jgi:hypothetical protein
MTAAMQSGKNAQSPLMREGEVEETFVCANPPQPPFFKGGRDTVEGSERNPPLKKGGEGGISQSVPPRSHSRSTPA